MQAEGKYIVVPPSLHESGKRYAWELSADPDNTPLAPWPEWLRPGCAGTQLGLAGPGNLGGTIDASDYRQKADGSPVAEGGRNIAAASLAGQYIHEGVPLGEAVRRLAEWNRTNPLPLPAGDVTKTVASVALTHCRNHPGEVLPITEAAALAGSEPLSHEDEQPAPADAPGESATAPPLPERLLSPPGIVGEIVAWMNRTAYKQQPALALGSALAFWGAVVGRKVATPQDLRTNLYCLGLGESGCGKDHPRKCIKKICAAAGVGGGLLGGEGVTSDAAIERVLQERPSVLFLFDEVGHMLSNATSRFAATHTRTVVPTLMVLFSSANTLYIGKEYAGAERERRDLDQPNACFYGTSVGAKVFGSITSGEIEDGFLGRMLVFQSTDPDPEERRDARPEAVPDEIVQAVKFWALGRRAEGDGNVAGVVSPCPLVAEIDEEADAVIRAFAAHCRDQRALWRARGLGALWARAAEHARKVALTVASGETMGRPKITASTARYAVDLVEYLTETLCRSVRDNVADTDHERDVLKVQRRVGEAGAAGISHTRLAQLTRELTPRRREEILKQLMESDVITRGWSEPKRGKPGPIYYLRQQNSLARAA